MVVVDTLIGKNRSARARLGVGMCTATFARGAVRDLSKLKVTHAGTLDETEGWEVREIDMPKWPDGSYMNALVFVTAPYGPGTPTIPDVRRFDIHDAGGGGGGTVHDLSCVDAGAGGDLAYPSLGAPPGTVHELACVDAGTGWDAASAVAEDPATVHELECLDAGAGADTARPTKGTPSTGKRFEGEIRFPGENVGETRMVRFTGTIESEVPSPRVEGATAIGKHYPPDLPAGVPAIAAGGTDTGPKAARYEYTRRRERNEWENGRIHRTYWELQDTAHPYFHQGWLTVGFSDPRTTDVTYTTGSPVELHPRQAGCEIGVWWTDFTGAQRVEVGGLLEKWALAPAGTQFSEGQCFGVRYGATNIPVAEIPVGLDRESALAQTEFPIWMMSENWEAARNFSWNGVVPLLAPAWEADHDAARAFILAQIGSQERPVIPNVFWGGTGVGVDPGESVSRFYGCVRRNRAAADQEDFAVTMQTWPAVRLKDPLFLEAIWPHVMQEACCRTAAHRREAPDFKGRGPAAPYRWEDHKNSWWYENGPFFENGLSNDFLGKNPTTELPVGRGWHMLFQSHYSAFYLTGAYLLTGDPQLKEAIDDLCQQVLSSHSIPPHIKSQRIDQARALGRELLMMAALIRCTNNEDVRARMLYRAQTMLPQVWHGGHPPDGGDPAGRPVRPTLTDWIGAEERPVIQPFGEAFVVCGLYAALLAVGDITNQNDPMRLLLNAIGESIVMYEWENVRRDPPNWHPAGLVSYNRGQPVNPGTPSNPNTAQWGTDENTDYVRWMVGSSRLMAVLGVDSLFNSGAAIRARATLVAAAATPDSAGFGGAGGFGRYPGWSAVLPP